MNSISPSLRTICFHDPRLASIAGGGETVTLQLAGWLADVGWQVTLCTEPSGHSPLLARFREKHLEVCVAEIEPAEPGEIQAALGAEPWLAKLHASDRLAPQSIAFGLAARQFYLDEAFDLVVVSFLPDLAGWEAPCPVLLNVFGLPPDRKVAALEAPLLAKCQHRTFASRYVQEEFAKLTDESQGTVLHAGIDEAFFVSSPPQSHAHDHDIVFAGRLVKRKGVAVLLEALHKLRHQRGIAASLTVAGEGPEQEHLKRLAEKLGLTNQVEWLGTLSAEALVRLLDQSRVFTYPTLLPEAFGCSVVEAMARRKVVVTTNLGGTADYIVPDYNALVCRPGDADDLAERLQLALTDQTMAARISAHAGEDARRFHPQAVKDAWLRFMGSWTGMLGR